MCCYARDALAWAAYETRGSSSTQPTARRRSPKPRSAVVVVPASGRARPTWRWARWVQPCGYLRTNPDPHEVRSRRVRPPALKAEASGFVLNDDFLGQLLADAHTVVDPVAFRELDKCDSRRSLGL